jgi:cell wall assembly regulator SMI1
MAQPQCSTGLEEVSDLDPSSQINSLWDRIERAVLAVSSETAATLAPPAEEAAIWALQDLMGLRLPADFVASLRRHDGQRDPSRCHEFSGAGILLGVDEIRENWHMCCAIDSELRRLPAPNFEPSVEMRWGGVSRREEEGPWWKPTLLPFSFAEGDMLCLDLDLGLGPSCGEEPGIAASYTEWLAELELRIRAGGLSVDETGFPSLKPRF